MLASINARAKGSGHARQLQSILAAITDDICCCAWWGLAAVLVDLQDLFGR